MPAPLDVSIPHLREVLTFEESEGVRALIKVGYEGRKGQEGVD
ncbi:Hypothetical protein D9617_16g014930 [Elsinoe fawcettii]|nr:Hypothetical protein D9617_16g014930 [Elsinoe fawcettii]